MNTTENSTWKTPLEPPTEEDCQKAVDLTKAIQKDPYSINEWFTLPFDLKKVDDSIILTDARHVIDMYKIFRPTVFGTIVSKASIPITNAAIKWFYDVDDDVHVDIGLEHHKMFAMCIVNAINDAFVQNSKLPILDRIAYCAIKDDLRIERYNSEDIAKGFHFPAKSARSMYRYNHNTIIAEKELCHFAFPFNAAVHTWGGVILDASGKMVMAVQTTPDVFKPIKELYRRLSISQCIADAINTYWASTSIIWD
jgi:hypothetical protein